MKQDGETALEKGGTDGESPTVVEELLNGEANELVRKIENGIIKGSEQKIQFHLTRILKSKYYPFYKEIKKSIRKKVYLEKSNIS